MNLDIPRDRWRAIPGTARFRLSACCWRPSVVSGGFRLKEGPHLNEAFESVDFAGRELSGEDFDSCTFANCGFLESNLSGSLFTDCQMIDCNLSMAVVGHTGLRNVAFVGCKVVGVDFGGCLPFLFAVSFDKCRLDYSRFIKSRLKKTEFKECSIRDADFTEADLTGASFDGCDLSNTLFSRTNLSKADFRRARNYVIDLEINVVRKARFSLSGVAGLLSKYDLVIE
jgi:fluoroquinolone resistance protein